MIHLYCFVVQAGFYGDAVECKTLSSVDWVGSPVAALVLQMFSPVTSGT